MGKIIPSNNNFDYLDIVLKIYTHTHIHSGDKPLILLPAAYSNIKKEDSL